jgi:uncharacterized protein
MRVRPYDREMQLVDELLRLSATDLANHLGCIHLSQLNRAAAQGLVRRPRWNDPLGDLLRERGHEHEKAYLAHLRATQSLKVVEIPGGSDAGGEHHGRGDARRRRSVYRAPLSGARCAGRADFLIKVPRPGSLGSWSYEVTDAKLATETRGHGPSAAYLFGARRGDQGDKPEQAHRRASTTSTQQYRLADYRRTTGS